MKNLRKVPLIITIMLFFLPQLDNAAVMPHELNPADPVINTSYKPNFFEKWAVKRLLKKANKHIEQDTNRLSDLTPEAIALEEKAVKYGKRGITGSVVSLILAFFSAILALDGSDDNVEIATVLLIFTILLLIISLYFAISTLLLAKKIEVRRAKKEIAAGKGCCGLIIGLVLAVSLILFVIDS